MEDPKKQEEVDLGTKVEQSVVNFFKGGSAESREPSNPEMKIPGSPNSEEENSSLDEAIGDERNLKTVAVIILIFGIVSSVILFFTIGFITVPTGLYGSSETVFSGTGFIISLSTLMSSIGMYFFLTVISNISISLKEIKLRQTITP